jgi:hypothetical protein
MDYGFRISKDGIDVKTGNDKDMVVTSKYPVLKGNLSGGGTERVYNEVTKTVTIAHGLDYIPFVIVRFYSADYGWWWDSPVGFDGPSGYLYMRGWCDATNITIQVVFVHEDPYVDITYKYFCYLDKAKL